MEGPEVAIDVLDRRFERPFTVFEDVAPLLEVVRTTANAEAAEASMRSRVEAAVRKYARACYVCGVEPVSECWSTLIFADKSPRFVAVALCERASCRNEVKRILRDAPDDHPLRRATQNEIYSIVLCSRVCTSWPDDSLEPCFSESTLERKFPVPGLMMLAEDKRLAMQLLKPDLQAIAEELFYARPRKCLGCGGKAVAYKDHSDLMSGDPWVYRWSLFPTCLACATTITKKANAWQNHYDAARNLNVSFTYYCATCGAHSLDKAQFQRCSRCKRRHFCSRDCQEKDWPEHKKTCKPQTDS